MKLTIEYTCPKCGLLTPGLLELPEGFALHSRHLAVPVEHECYHCDEPLSATYTVGQLLDMARKQVAGF